METRLNLRIDEELLIQAKAKCKEQFGIGISSLIKVFLKSFVTQHGVGFYVGDDDLCKLFDRWLRMKKSGENKKGSQLYNAKLRDLYNLNSSKSRPIIY